MAELPKQQTRVVWLCGLSGAGKTTLAQQAAAQLRTAGRQVVVLDGDELRTGVCHGLGYTVEGRTENVRRTAELARLLSHQGCLVLVALMTPLHSMRELARQILGDSLSTVHLRCDHATCAARDVKGLYREAAAGRLPHFPGTDMAFEDATEDEMSLDSGCLPIEECLRWLLNLVSEIDVPQSKD